LAIDIAGKKGYLPGQIMADNIFRGNAFITQTFYLSDLRST
jgi:hypothetical protein